MLRLFKYEMRKTLFAKLVILGLAAVAEAAFLIGISIPHEQTYVLAAVALYLIAIGGIITMGLQSIVTLHRDMNTRQGYMLFMTPNSCYRILGAKVLECSVSVLLAGAFFFVLGLLDMNMLLSLFNESLWSMITQFVQSFDSRLVFNAATMSAFVFCFVAMWLADISAAYLADVISSSLLNGKKGGLFITFVFYLILVAAENILINRIPAMSTLQAEYVCRALASLVLAGITYVVSARVMAKHLSV